MKRFCLVAATLVLLVRPNLATSAGITPSQHAITADGDLLLEGENIQVVGSIHANGRVTLRGSISIQGTVEAGNDIVLDGSVTADHLIQRAGRTANPTVDFTTLKRGAALVLPGNTELPRFIFGTVYIEGSLTAFHPFGSGVLVAEGDLTVFAGLGRPSGMPIDLMSRRWVSFSGSRVHSYGFLGVQGIDIRGRDLNLRGPVIGGDVHIRGTNITVRDGPPTFTWLLPSQIPAPVIEAPAARTPLAGDPFLVVGKAVPNARVRIKVGYFGPSAAGYAFTGETMSDSDGRFSLSVTIVVIRRPGSWFLTAEIVDIQGNQLSPVTAISISVSPTR